MFRTWVTTQAQDGNRAAVHDMFGAFQNSVNVWFAARVARNELPGYITDLDIARGLADEAARSDPSASAITLQARYALLLSTIHELANSVSPTLARRLVEVGVWTRAQAMTWGRLATEPGDASGFLVNMLREVRNPEQSSR